MNSSMRRASLGERYFSSWKSFTAPPNLQGNSLTSKRVIGPMPLTPLTTLAQAVSTVLPTGEMMPIPVTTTRRLLKRCSGLSSSGWSPVQPAAARQRCAAPQCDRRSGLGAPVVDVVDRLLHGGDLLGLFVRDLDLELLFQGHHQLDRIQRVSAEVIDEGRVARHLLGLDAQLLGNDGFDLAFDAAHLFLSSRLVPFWPGFRGPMGRVL